MRRATLVLILFALAAASPSGDSQEKLQGYAEFRKGADLIVDGQRVRTAPWTHFKGKGVTDFASIPLGFEVQVSGTRLPDGAIVAQSIDASPNGNALFKREVKQGSDSAEQQWVNAGRMFQNANGKEVTVGELVPSGPEVQRVQRLVQRLVPPYVSANTLRVHVVRTKMWNACAMGNGSIWVYTGLMDDTNDDELGFVLGHELTHYTHEHTRREFKRNMMVQLIAVGAVTATAVETDSAKASAAVGLAALFSVAALQNGYSRDMEDQADRVGLRYAYEAGFDVTRAPGMWARMLGKYPDQSRVTNFFFGNHAQTAIRIKNINRELDLNYRQPRK